MEGLSSTVHAKDPVGKKEKSSRPKNNDSGSGSSVNHDVDELSNKGFITLNTHDVSFVDEHIPSIDKFAKDLQSAIDAAWPTRREGRYSQAHVLLLSWEDDNLGVYQEMQRLEYVFSNLYRFDVK